MVTSAMKLKDTYSLVLIDAVKGGRSYVHVEAPLIVYREKGVYTQEVREIYG